MNKKKRERLTDIALKGLDESAPKKPSDEAWSYIFEGRDCVSLSYCSWDEVSEFDGDTELELPWSGKRRALIELGEAEPNLREFRQWQRARARSFADAGEASVGFIKRIAIEGKEEGFAVFSGHTGGAAEDAPGLEGVFDTAEKALSYLKAQGVVALQSIERFDAWRKALLRKRRNHR